jgi:hypothetical protein
MALEMRRVGLAAAARQAFPMPWLVVRAAAVGFAQLSGTDAPPEFRGPVGIVSESSKWGRSGWGSWLCFWGTVGAYLWPFLGGITLFDAVTGAVFRAAYPGIAGSTLTGYHWERLRQALVLSCTGYAMMVLAVVLAVGHVPGALLLLAWAMPSTAASFPLIWLAGKAMWGRGAAAACLLAAMFVPCILFVAVALLIASLRRALEAEGFRVSGLRSQPPPVAPST